ncbi:MAG TPA: HlyD family efflux transporter periplasmic adaptor subunit, partial [Candidatus Paceibacterota bacterium]
VWYYESASKPPANLPGAGDMTPAFVTTSGVVEPAQNPNLSFQSGGRVARVNVKVGGAVGAGNVLASLDTSVLSAQRLGAVAALQVQQAKLDAIKAPARDVDTNAKRTAVASAQTTLASLYATIPTSIGQACDTSFSGISVYTDSMFSQPTSPIDPGLAFSTKDNTLANAASAGRLKANQELATWQSETTSLSGASTDQLDQALTTSIAHLQVIRSFADSLIAALNNAIPAGSFTATVLATDQTSVSAYRDAINAQIAALQSAQKNLAADKLAIQSAQDTLNQTLAGATSQDIEAQQAQVQVAQANLANIDAQIGLATIIAPFSGTVGSVQVKVGDQVTPGTVAVALNPKSNLEVRTYVSESDAGRLKAGMAADVTLDAYGSSRHFPATITAVDNSPTNQNGVPAYQVTLQFNQNDSAISSGMTANITINL